MLLFEDSDKPAIHMKREVILVVLVLTGIGVQAQKYGNALGVRFGNGDHRMLGLTFSQHIFKKISVEGILQSDFERNTTSHLLIREHHSILGKRLNIFLGTGVSIGNEESTFEDPSSKQVITTYDNKTIGADLIVGGEVTLLGLNVTLDYKPNFNLTGRETWYEGQVGFSVRKVLISYKDLRKKKRKKKREKRRDDRQSDKN